MRTRQQQDFVGRFKARDYFHAVEIRQTGSHIDDLRLSVLIDDDPEIATEAIVGFLFLVAKITSPRPSFRGGRNGSCSKYWDYEILGN